MNRLPVEILNQIFLLFDQKQKIEYMQVCRNWERTIKEYSLFHTVRISTMSGLNQLIEKVQKEPAQGTRVERLIFDFIVPHQFDMNLILRRFPNIQVLYVFGCEETQNLKAMVVYPWYRHILFVIENRNLKLPGSLLASGLCSYLKILSVSSGFSNSRKIISLLPYAPTLEKLKLAEFNFTMDDLELLHTSLPHLHTLLFYNGQLYDSKFPSKIEPTTTMKILRMHFLDVFEIETQARFLQYIKKKYIQLFELSIHAVCYDIQDDKIDMIYNNGWIPLFQTLGPRLTTLAVDPKYIPESFFEILDESGCQIRNLHLHSHSLYSTLEGFRKSQHMKFISSLVLEDPGGSLSRFEWLKELLSLRKLKIVCPRTIRRPIQLNDILELCPEELESLSIQDGELILDTSRRHLFSVRSLSFCRVIIPGSIDIFITQYIPKLHSLIFDNCKLHGRHFNMSTSNLQYLEILDYFPPNSNNILVKTLSDNKKRWYNARHKMASFGEHKELFDIHESQVYPVIKSFPYEKLVSLPFITLTCNSIRDLVVISKE